MDARWDDGDRQVQSLLEVGRIDFEKQTIQQVKQ
jgi:hypothetical protein